MDYDGSGCKVLVKSVQCFLREVWCTRPTEKNVGSSLIAFQVIGAIHLLHNFQSHEYFTSLRLLVNVAQPVVNYLEQDVTF